MALNKTEPIINNEDKIEQYIHIINDYFITIRNKFLHQLHNGSYVTCPNEKSQKKQLNDYNIRDHLQHKETYGVLVNKITKFIVFDIDGTTLTNAGHMKHILINRLVELGFERDYIFTVFSGHKGYHVYLFLEAPYAIDTMNVMQAAIIQKLEDTYKFSESLGRVEIRPTATQGVKLPLGLHQGTKKICWFCDENDHIIESYDVLFDLKRVPKAMIDKVFASIKYNNNHDHCLSKAAKDYLTPKNSTVSSDKTQELKEAYEDGILLPHTRHNTLLAAALYLKSLGRSETECLKELSVWMNKQDADVITTPKSKWQFDVNRVVKDIYAKEVSPSGSQLKEIFITKKMIRFIYQNTRTKSERAVLLLMIVDFIKYQNHLEDGGFRASVTHISEKAQISPSMAKNIPRKLAARNLIIRKSGKPSTNPLVKVSSLYGKLVTWYTLGDDLAKLYHDALIGTEEHLPIDTELELYQQLNCYLHLQFTEGEIRQWLKRDAFRSSELLYKNFYIENIAKSKCESLDSLTA